MNKNIINTLLVGTSALALLSCSENTWNDHFLKGFESGVDYENTIEAEFTLTADDYKAVASNATNKSLAEVAGAGKALKAVGDNGMFSAAIPAQEYLPAYLASSSCPYYLASDGSKVNVTYLETGITDPIIDQVAGAVTYTVTKDDYINVWGSDKDYIDAFAPMAPAANKIPAILKKAVADATAGQLAIVSYNESATNPIFISDSDVEEFTGGFCYLVADGSNGAGPYSSTKNYGYLPQVEMTVTDGSVKADEINVFNFIPTDGGFYIMDAYNRYLYQTGNYDSFNFSAALPSSGAIWTVNVASNGQATITNTAVGKWIQYGSDGYKSWGSYKEAKGSLPVLYKASAVKYYLVTEDGHGAGPVAGSKPYGYLAGVDMTVEKGIITNADPANAFTFELTDGGYYIKDSSARYLYMKGSYNNFNLTTDIPEAGGIWTISEDAAGNLIIKNAEMGKWMQYDSGYNNWGVYDSEKGTLPKMYNAAASAPAEAKAPAKIVAGTPVTSNMNAVYEYDGSKWAPAQGVTILNAADYTAMGFDNNNLKNPEIYLPLFLKVNKPYAVAGDMMAVVYNGSKCSMLVFDGQEWTINNNDLQTKTAKFIKQDGTWKFVKYIGKAYFNKITELILDRSYLFVAEGICAVPLDASKNYGYLYTSPVAIVNDEIEQKNEVNAFTFASSATVDGTDYKLQDGQFMIIDSNGRYLYMTGTYDSFNVSKAPVVKDGTIDQSYVWEAVCDGETWTIKNVSNNKWIQYSIQFTSFGSYSTESGVLPSLYMLSAE